MLKYLQSIAICVVLQLLSSVALHAQPFPNGGLGSRAKKQKAVPRFPPQFHSRDTTQAVRDSIARVAAQKSGQQNSTGFNRASNGVLQPASPAAQKAALPRTDSFVKIISKKEDALGNITIEQETQVGKKKWRQTITVGGIQLNKPFRADTIDKDSITIQVVKKSHKMFIYHKHRFLTAYKCVFGPPHLEQKMHEGDRRTPEGWFKILEIRPHSEWVMFMLIDYPNQESYRLFEENKKNKLIPANARIGGAVGIHGVWEGANSVVDQKRNWTDGCIALKKEDLIQLSTIVKVGTPIFVKRAPEAKK